jgi:hypothetical protein
MTANMAVMNMAPNVNPRLHRTQRGVKEIRKKSHVLTQCERLILALVDGESSIDVLKRKLGGVIERRFRLAVADLRAKGFIEERMSAENAQADSSIDSVTLENFVRQDPLDPVTITALRLQPQMLNVPAPAVSSDLGDLESATLFVPTEPEVDTSRGVDIYLPLEPQPLQETKPTQSKAPTKPMASELITGNTSGVTAPRAGSNSNNRRARRERRSRYIQIGYWLLFAGLVCVALMIAALRSGR